MPPIEGKKTMGLGVSAGQGAAAPTPVVALPVVASLVPLAQPDSYMAPNQRLPSQGKPGAGWNTLGLQSQGTLPQLSAAAEFQNMENEGVAIPDAHNDTQRNTNYSRKPLSDLLLTGELHVLAGQLKQYLAQS